MKIGIPININVMVVRYHFLSQLLLMRSIIEDILFPTSRPLLKDHM